MYEILALKENLIEVKISKTNQILQLSTTDQISDFIKTFKYDISTNDMFNILSQITNPVEFNTALSDCENIIMDKTKRDSSRESFDFIKNNLNKFDFENFNSFSIVDKVLCFSDKKEIKNFYTKNQKNLNIDQKLLFALYNDSKTKKLFLKENQKSLPLYKQSLIVSSLSDTNMADCLYKIKFLNENKNNLTLKEKHLIISTIPNDKLKLDFIKENQKALSQEQISYLTETMSSQNNKLVFLKDNINILSPEHKMRILYSVYDVKTKLTFLKNNIDDFITSDIKRIINSCSYSDNQKLLNFIKKNPDLSTDVKRMVFEKTFDTPPDALKIYESNLYNCQDILSVDFVYNKIPSANQYAFLERHLDKFSGKNLFSMNIAPCQQFSINNILYKNKDKLTSDQILYFISNSFPCDKLSYYEEFKDRLNPKHKLLCLITIKGLDYENLKPEIDQTMNELNIAQENRELTMEIVNTLGIWNSINDNSLKLLTQKGLSLFDQEDIFQLFKFAIYTDTLPDISKATENPELYKKFAQFRANNIPQNMLNIVNNNNTLTSFQKHFDLIKDCLNSNLTPQEQKIFSSVLQDENVNISAKEDLENYPTKRSEYIDSLIDTDIDSAIIYLLTGYSKQDYHEKEFLFFRDDQLETSLKDFPEELRDDITLLQITKQLINSIENEPLENKQKIIETLKLSLEQEFSLKGSVVAKMRNSFSEFETTLRKTYGKELQQSLQSHDLPSTKNYENVSLIDLKGEEFTLLIHGLNAYGRGSKTYESKNVGKSYICTSLISNNCLERANAEIYYGFKNISSESLAMESPYDLASYGAENSLDLNAMRKTRFLKSDEIIKESENNNTYNEVVLFRDYVDKNGNVKQISPDYIIAFDKISEKDIEEAKRLEIPIVLIDQKCYRKEKTVSSMIYSTLLRDETSKSEEKSINTTNLSGEIMKITEKTKSKNSTTDKEKAIDDLNKFLEDLEQEQKETLNV